MTRIELLLFDLGGVIIDFAGLREVSSLLPEPLSEEQIRVHWLESPCIQQFELGKLSPDEFARRFVVEWGLGIPPEEFLGLFEGWSRRLLPGAPELLAELGQRYRLAALSNSNELHWKRNRVSLGIENLFERVFSSHELGFLKPDPRIYDAALDRLGVAPDAVVFLDDNIPNVDGAAAVGISAHLAHGVEGVRVALARAGVLLGPGQ